MESSSPLSLSRARPGGHELRREVVVHHQRERMLDAALALIAKRGYRAVTVADIVKGAAIARAKFYENFSSKSDCFLVAVDRSLEQALGVAAGALAAASGPPAERLGTGVEALLAYFAEHPDVARACLVEAPLLGPELDELRERARVGFTALLDDALVPPDKTGRDPVGADAVIAGLYWILYNAVLSGEPADLRQLAPELIDFTKLSLPALR